MKDFKKQISERITKLVAEGKTPEEIMNIIKQVEKEDADFSTWISNNPGVISNMISNMISLSQINAIGRKLFAANEEDQRLRGKQNSYIGRDGREYGDSASLRAADRFYDNARSPKK